MNRQKGYALMAGMLFLLLPQFAAAQTDAAETAFTRQALTVGFIILSVIVLVFLGLMLKARVNEYQSFLRKDAREKKALNPWQELMSLDEEEIASLAEKREKNH